MSKYCADCNKEYSDDTMFCPGCGMKLSERNGFIDLDDSLEVQPQPKAQVIPAGSTDSPTVDLQYTSSAPADAVVLKSSAPIPSKIGWTKWGYIIGLLLIAAGGFGVIILIAVFIISHFQMSFHKDKMRKMKFKFVDNTNSDDIYNKLQPILVQKYGDKIEFEREGDTLSVHYKSIIYDINVQEDSTVSIWWRKSFAAAFFSFNEWKEYKKIRTGTAIVAYELQKAFGIR